MELYIPGIKTFVFGRYSSLLLGLFVLIILQPTVETPVGRMLLEGLFIAVLFAGLQAVGVKKGLLRFQIVLLAVSLTLSITGSVLDQEALFFLGILCRVVFMSLIALAILFDLFQDRKVSGDTLAGAVCVYLLLAVICAYNYLLIEFMMPGSFSFTEGHGHMQLWIAREFYPFFYFSLVTMTTVGYGDMAPVTHVARTMATMEALMGQIYLTILVARLVGMYLLSQQEQER